MVNILHLLHEVQEVQKLFIDFEEPGKSVHQKFWQIGQIYQMSELDQFLLEADQLCQTFISPTNPSNLLELVLANLQSVDRIVWSLLVTKWHSEIFFTYLPFFNFNTNWVNILRYQQFKIYIMSAELKWMWNLRILRRYDLNSGFETDLHRL